jgi:ATP-dependent Clp protease protease subunit
MSVPYVIEKGPNNQERVYDLFSRLLKDRIVFVRGVIDESTSDSVVAQLLFLESDSPTKDISMYINSPGGSVNDMYAIYDTMNYIKPDITTIGFGRCMSAASFLLAAGTKGKRYCLPNLNLMIHELSSGIDGKFKDMKNYHKHLESLHDKMAKHYVKFTGQKLAKIKKDMELDYFMSAEEAKKYGLVDEVQYDRK